MAASGEYDAISTNNQRMPNVQDLDVTVLAFAQWLSELRARSNASLQQMLAEMGIIRNGITSNNTDLTEFKRNTATVQQQMQSQISDLRDKLTDAYTEIANMKKTKSQFEQEVHAECQSLSETLQFRTLELETLKKGYGHQFHQFQQELIKLQAEVSDIRMKGDDAHRVSHTINEQNVKQVSEVEMAAHYANTELKKVRSDHDQAISNLAENMNRWNDTLRDLSKEFHDFQKVMNVNQQRIQSSLWDVQAKAGIMPSSGEGARMDGEAQRSSAPRELARPSGSPGAGVPSGQMQGTPGQPAATLRAQSPPPTNSAQWRTTAQPPLVPPYSAIPQAGTGPPTTGPFMMMK